MHDRSLRELSLLRAEVRRLRNILNQKTPALAVLLKRRGFTIYKQEPADDLLVPARRYVAEYYRMLHKYSFRLFLRDVIKHQQSLTLDHVTRYATPAVTGEYLEYLRSVKMIKKKGSAYVLAKGPIMSFGETLEWYIAELFRRELGSEAVWGVKFKRPRVGGDYDVIARYEGSLFYIEVKSSPPKQIYDSEIAAFLDRVDDLSPAIAVFLMDTELRMKDKVVPMFEKELKKRFKKPPSVLRMERELFHIRDRIFIINAKESVLRNIETVSGWYYRKTFAHPELTTGMNS